MNNNKYSEHFSDVVIKPVYSTIASRNDVDISSKIHNNVILKLPVISANMKNITGPKMATTMWDAGGLGILHRFDTIQQARDDYRWVTTPDNDYNIPLIGVSLGVQAEDKERFAELYCAGARIFCIDVAHGHHEHTKKMLLWITSELFKWSRSERSKICLIAGNVCTPEAVYDLNEWGADVAKVGIAGGCFLPDTKITTSTGQRKIQDIKPGEIVLTHTGKYEEVTTTFKFDNSKEVVEINNSLKCTNDHKIYVVHKNDVNKITDDNIHLFAKWVPADQLTTDYFLIESQEKLAN